VVFPDTGETLGWTGLRDTVRVMARGLAGLGVARGESVAILHPNGKEGLLALFACLYGGFRATMINLAAGPDAMAFALTHSGARFAFVHDSQDQVFARIAPPGMAAVAMSTLPEGGFLHALAADDHALLMYTSGTTGQPKGVVHSHASLLAGGWTTAVAHALTPQDRGFCVLPIYHINGLCVTVMGALVSGGSFAMAPRFSASTFWDQVGQGGVSWFSVVPTIISHLLHGDVGPPDAVRRRLRFGRSASSALAVETQSAFEARFGVPIVETMGLTETAAQILSNPLPPGVRKVGSPGIAYGNEVRILTSDLAQARTGEEGEIAVRGPNVMREYLHNPEATAATFAQDWLRTGDLGRMDADGYVFVTGRMKELIIKGGENIAPREIDEVLYSHPQVVEAAAFARACTRYGERVEAAVALRPGAQMSVDDLMALCHERLGAFKSPDVIHLMEELPKGPSGKIQRLKLSALIPERASV
jgi:acyl-CoA synthetase (AMP-forming)/AMP-acid ligase II